jgi:aspartate ammonia-lyase
MRIERDSLGEREIPSNVYYGIQTLRAIENFPVSGLKAHPLFIKAYAMVKKGCALANIELSKLDPIIGNAIVSASDEILNGELIDQFIVDVFQAGAGTSFNMNVNEVIANRALEILDKKRGDYKYINPNDHVNMSQSTNDTFPTAMHISILLMLKELNAVLINLRDAFNRKGREFFDIIKAGRTHLQDAVPIRLGQEFRSYGSIIEICRNIINDASNYLKELPIGGTALGTGINSHPDFKRIVIDKLRDITRLDIKYASDPIAAMNSKILISTVSSSLRNLALELIRIANDLRLLSSGPLTGIGEIKLPAVQPGSSIMPGKINPVMAECLNMIGFQVVGNDLATSIAVQAGQLELNVMMPIMAHNILQSLTILINFLPLFTEKCVDGITADKKRCEEYFEKSPSIATILSPYIGYLSAAEIVKESLERNLPIRKLILEKGILREEELNKIMDPDLLCGKE